MKKNLQTYLTDALDAIENIEKISSGLTIDDMNNITKKWALERGISIIGEAVYQADKLQKELPITHLIRIKGTRHIIVHDYDVVDKFQIFSIVVRHLPLLKQEIQSILNIEK
jgi:uncharacterized protein with HEPN domain